MTAAQRFNKRLLVFIVAYNAERTITATLKRIPVSLLQNYDVEVLVIDDGSQDGTFETGQHVRRSAGFPFKLTVLFNPINQGYGGNQKIGFRHAIEHRFDGSSELFPSRWFRIVEFPTHYVGRNEGISKLRYWDLVKAALAIFEIAWRQRITGFRQAPVVGPPSVARPAFRPRRSKHDAIVVGHAFF
jgi:hypothetical protein